MVKHLEQPNLLAQQYAVAELQSLFEIWLTCASGLLFAVTPAATVNLKSQPQTELNEPGISRGCEFSKSRRANQGS